MRWPAAQLASESAIGLPSPSSNRTVSLRVLLQRSRVLELDVAAAPRRLVREKTGPQGENGLKWRFRLFLFGDSARLAGKPRAGHLLPEVF